jgi:hypothetical protein
MIARALVGNAACLVFLILISRCGDDPSSERMHEEKLVLRQQMQQSVAAVNQEIQNLTRQRIAAKGSAATHLQARIERLESVRSELCDRIVMLEDMTRDQWNAFRHEAVRSLDRARNMLRVVSIGPRMVSV